MLQAESKVSKQNHLLVLVAFSLKFCFKLF
jgi:hypothetical protein